MKLKDITVSIFDGKHGDCKDKKGSGLYFISVKDIREFDIDYSNAREIEEQDFISNYQRTKLEPGDTIYANTGDTIGKSIFVFDNPLVYKTSFQKSVAIIKPNIEFVLPRYLYYLLKYETPRLRKASTGSGQKNLLLSTMREFEISIHSKDDQSRISHVLGLIDDKIRLNNEINDNLQQLTRMIYEQYFLQYSFNNEKLIFDSSINRNRPLSWKVCKAKDILNICLGGTPDTSIKEYWNGNINWLNSGEIANFPIVESELNITQLGVDNSATKLMPKNTTLVSITGNIRATITAIDTCANQSVVGVHESDLLHASYIYPVICDLLQHFTKVSGGNCQKHINKGTIDNMNILIPPTNVLLEYYSKVESSYQNIMRSALENKILVSLRNELLPLLINGQVTID